MAGKKPKIWTTHRTQAGLLERFAARRWRENWGVWISDMIRDIADTGGVPRIAKMAAAVPGTFLTNNRVKRAEVRAELERYFDGVTVKGQG